MELSFRGEVWYWRGPSPFHFITVPSKQCEHLQAVSPQVTYGWGMIPVSARIGDTDFTTSLFPKEGGYLLPLKSSVRAAEGLEVGATVAVRLTVAI